MKGLTHYLLRYVLGALTSLLLSHSDIQTRLSCLPTLCYVHVNIGNALCLGPAQSDRGLDITPGLHLHVLLIVEVERRNLTGLDYFQHRASSARFEIRFKQKDIHPGECPDVYLNFCLVIKSSIDDNTWPTFVTGPGSMIDIDQLDGLDVYLLSAR